MSTIKISELPAITGANTATTDVLPIVDTSLSTTNKITRAEFFKNIPDMEINDKIIHAGDTNTAIRFPAADTVTVETSGVERLRVDSSGNVGIGTSSPQTRFEAFGGDARVALAAGSAATLRGYQIASGTTEFASLKAEASLGETRLTSGFSGFGGFSTFYTNGSERMRINASGNVGIGTTSISYPLDVASASNATIRLTRTASHNVTLNAISGGAFTIGLDGSGGTTERLRIDGSGNLGLGVTPSAWDSIIKPLELNNGVYFAAQTDGEPVLYTGANNYYGSGAFRYKLSSKEATRYQQNQGVHSWYTAPSGTAGNAITFTQAMTLDASGRLLVGTTTGVGGDFTSVRFNSGGSYPQALNMVDSNASASGSVFQVFRKSDDTYLGNIRRNGTDNAIFVGGNSYLALGSGDTERARIDPSGNLLVGLTTGGKFSVSYGGNDTHFGLGANYDNYITAGASGVTILRNGNTERARIDASGNLLVGTTSNPDGSRLRVFQSILGPVANVTNERNVSGDIVMLLGNKANANNTNSYYLICQEPDVANRLFIFGNGNVVNLNNSYGALSDEKLKENIIDSGSQWDDLKAVRVRKYSLKADNANGPNQIGVIAQELEAAGMGGLVFESPELGVNNEPTGETIKQVNYSVLYMKAVKALQEAMTRIEALEARLAAANL